MIERFAQIVQERHDYARQWKARTGGRVAGYLCTYVPEELLFAAGVLPLRVMGSHEPQDVTEPHIFSIFCPFCRDTLAQGLKGRYNYLDGLVKARSCMHMRNTFTSWRRHVPVPFSYYFGMPSVPQLESSRDFLVGELQAFKEALEEWTGQAITSAALSEAIEAYNTNRRLMRQLYQTRKKERPLLSGAEAMQVAVASQVMDKREHSTLLSALLSGLDAHPSPPSPGTRLMLVGTENDDADLVAMMESKGALVVADDHCSGSRYFWNDVETDVDPLEAIATRYIERPRCPAKDFPKMERLDHVVGIARDYSVQGVIILQQKFCEPFEYEIPPLQARLKEEGIPSLLLEYDLAMNAGTMGSRIEAFLEMIELEI